jgi:hypothetical protein
MAQDRPQDHISRKRVLYTLPGMDEVTIRRQVEYQRSGDSPLTADFYYPPASGSGAPLPAVVFVVGFPDPGARRFIGCTANEMASYISWAQLVAASGLVAVTYVNNEPADVHAVFDYVRQNAAALGIDAEHIGVWSCSGSGPMGLSVLMQNGPHAPRCGALLYPYTLDLDESAGTAAAAKQWGFTNACAGKTLDDFPRDRPLFIARAGQDQMPALNRTLDRFTGAALARNLPITVVNHPTGPHAFDLFDDSEVTRDVVRQTLRFLTFQLRPDRG